MFAPSDETINTVRNWLVDSGIAASRIVHSDTKGWYAFDATTSELENLLNTQYYTYEHFSTDEIAAACDEWDIIFFDSYTPAINIETGSWNLLNKIP